MGILVEGVANILSKSVIRTKGADDYLPLHPNGQECSTPFVLAWQVISTFPMSTREKQKISRSESACLCLRQTTPGKYELVPYPGGKEKFGTVLRR